MCHVPIAGLAIETRVVLLSTYKAEDLPADARDCGALAYLHKEDFEPEVLERIWAQPSFEVHGLDSAEETRLPSDEELRLIREVIDPKSLRDREIRS